MEVSIYRLFLRLLYSLYALYQRMLLVFLIWTRHAKAVFWINHLQLLLAKALLLTEPES
nr:MAG TPA: hypothetical protein [Inoviridae sp.]